MATIALYANKINQMPGLIKDIKKSVSGYKDELFSLKKKTLTINSSVCNLDDVISSIQSSSQTQEQKIAALDNFSQNNEQFIKDTARIDSDVADIVKKRKDEFYDKYYYLKPDCEKNGWEKYVKDFVTSGVEFFKENWKIIVKIYVVVLLVAVSVVLLCTGVGGVLAAMAWGAILGAAIGGLSGGIMSAVRGGSFLEGFVDGAFTGAIGGAIGGGVTSGLTALIGPATTLVGSILQGAAIGAVSGGVSNMAVSAISIYLEKGTLSGSFNTILMSGFTGALAGGIVGGITGGVKFKLSKPSPGDVNFMDKNDRFFKNVSNRSDVDANGSLDIIAHGSADKIEVNISGSKTLVDSRTAANLIQNSSEYSGQNIRLLSCSTGSVEDGFAQNLANKLNVKVTAPSDILWARPDGSTFVAAGKTDILGNFVPDYSKPLGGFIDFLPGGNIIK